MQDIKVHRVEGLPDDVLNKLVSLLDIAFSTEKAIRDAVGEKDFKRVLTELNKSQLIAASLGGHIYVATEISTSKVVGCCLWFEPGREIYDTEEQRQKALIPYMQCLSPEVREWHMKIKPDMDAFREKSYGKGVVKASWNLHRVGVLPEYQGRGIGTALIDAVRSTLVHTSITLNAVEEKNVSYYKFIGFKVKGAITKTTLFGATFTTTAFMWP